jgi:hypothetical protein
VAVSFGLEASSIELSSSSRSIEFTLSTAPVASSRVGPLLLDPTVGLPDDQGGTLLLATTFAPSRIARVFVGALATTLPPFSFTFHPLLEECFETVHTFRFATSTSSC